MKIDSSERWYLQDDEIRTVKDGFFAGRLDSLTFKYATGRLNIILTAPELLNELKRMVMYYEYGETRPEALAKINDSKKAIAKAESDYKQKPSNKSIDN